MDISFLADILNFVPVDVIKKYIDSVYGSGTAATMSIFEVLTLQILSVIAVLFSVYFLFGVVSLIIDLLTDLTDTMVSACDEEDQLKNNKDSAK